VNAWFAAGVFVVVSSLAPAAQTSASKTLRAYVTDTEGGKTVLWITPSGQTVLVDTGNPGERDTGRLMEAIRDAGVDQIDFLISTHYHADHVGGMQELAKRIPIKVFVDHGPTVEEREQVPGFQAAYKALHARAQHIVVKPGDRLPINGLDLRIVTAAGQSLKTPLTGAGKPNPTCASFTPKDITHDPENGQSVGYVLTFGQFRAIDLGDLLWNKEYELMCPNNPIGTVDLYMVTHHGTDSSGPPQLVHALRPRVAVMQNGTRKGAGAETMPTLRTSPGLEDIWQLHWGLNAGIEQNSAGVFIANLDGAPAPGAPGGAAATAPGAPLAGALPAGAPSGAQPGRGAPPHTPAYWIKIVAQQDGSFTVSNSRNGYSKTYTNRK
jgi:competence protein ComEC